MLGEKFTKTPVSELPKKDGKYIVFTKRRMGDVGIIHINFHLTNGKPNWGCTNQIVTHWLKPDEE